MDWNFDASSKQRHSFLKWSPKWSVLHVFLYSILHNMCDLYFSTFCFCLVTHFYIFQLGKLSQKWFYCRIPRDKSLLIFFFFNENQGLLSFWPVKPLVSRGEVDSQFPSSFKSDTEEKQGSETCPFDKWIHD